MAGWGGHCPSRFWQNRRCLRVAAACLITYYSPLVLGSYILTPLKAIVSYIFIIYRCTQFCILNFRTNQNLGSFQFRIGKKQANEGIFPSDWSKMRENSRFKIGETIW